MGVHIYVNPRWVGFPPRRAMRARFGGPIMKPELVVPVRCLGMPRQGAARVQKTNEAKGRRKNRPRGNLIQIAGWDLPSAGDGTATEPQRNNNR